MMFITLVYVGSDTGGVRKNYPGGGPVPGLDGTCVHTSVDPRYCICNESQSAVMMSRYKLDKTSSAVPLVLEQADKKSSNSLNEVDTF
jgi:hypothetical protein